MERKIFTEEHDAFRDMVREFIAREVTPHHAQWERDGIVSRDVWLAAGRAGLLGIDVDEKYGGGGNPDYRYYLDPERGVRPGRGHGPGLRRAQRHRSASTCSGCAPRSSGSAGCPATARAS